MREDRGGGGPVEAFCFSLAFLDDGGGDDGDGYMKVITILRVEYLLRFP